jgi:hypothetical protein
MQHQDPLRIQVKWCAIVLLKSIPGSSLKKYLRRPLTYKALKSCYIPLVYKVLNLNMSFYTWPILKGWIRNDLGGRTRIHNIFLWR